MESNTYLCAYCGAPLSLNDKECSHCYQPVFITHASVIRQNMNKLDGKKINLAYRRFCEKRAENEPQALLSLGITHLQQESYDFAIRNLKKAAELLIDDVDAYYYLAIASLRGKRPRKCTLSVIKEVTGYLDTALNLEDQGRVYYLYGVIIDDFYNWKKLRYRLTSSDMFNHARAFKVNDEDILEIRSLCHLDG